MENIAKLLQGISSLAWPALVAFFIYRFKSEIRAAASELASRLRAGSSVKVGGLIEIGQIERLAEPGQPVREQEIGRVSVRTDKRLQKEIEEEQHQERFTFLVHFAYPLNRIRREYDVILYMWGHFNNLEHVTKVEYFLGEGWDNAVFISSDRRKSFAIKISAIGAFLAMARVHFQDGSLITQSRFVELDPVY